MKAGESRAELHGPLAAFHTNEVGVSAQTDDGAIDAWRNEGNPN
jgi:hypothetical protein